MDSIWKLMGSPWRRLSRAVMWLGSLSGRVDGPVAPGYTQMFWGSGPYSSHITLWTAFSTFLKGWLCLSVIKARSTDTSGTHQRNPSLICYNSALARSWLETFDVCKRPVRAHVKHPFIHILWAQARYWVGSSESHVSGPYYLSPLQKCSYSVKI